MRKSGESGRPHEEDVLCWAIVIRQQCCPAQSSTALVAAIINLPVHQVSQKNTGCDKIISGGSYVINGYYWKILSCSRKKKKIIKLWLQHVANNQVISGSPGITTWQYMDQIWRVDLHISSLPHSLSASLVPLTPDGELPPSQRETWLHWQS